MFCSFCQSKKVLARGLCAACYARMRSHGTPERKNVVNVGRCKIDGCKKEAIAVVGDELLRLSEHEVPHDEGTLQNTGVSERDGDDHIVGYNQTTIF